MASPKAMREDRDLGKSQDGELEKDGQLVASECDPPPGTPSSEDLQQLFQWNSTFPHSVNSCVHSQIEAQAKIQPDGPAISAWDGDFTYRAFDDCATRLAHFLVRHGIGPEVLVPFCFDKSAWTVVIMIAILKAGGGCVALDPAESDARLENLLRKMDVKLVLTSPSYEYKFYGMRERVLSLTPAMLRDDIPKVPGLACNTVKPSNVASVIFTSGSTGQPKGVVLEHAAICTNAEASGSAKGITTSSRVLQFSSYTFGGSIQDHFFVLIRGGCICIPSDHERRGDIKGAINRMKVNWTFLTPSVVTLLKPSDVPTLKTLTLGGEALTAESIRIWAPSVRLLNTYGMAENTVSCVAHEYLDGNGNPRTIGKPLGSLAWITDVSSHNRLVAIGAIGELLLEGPMLARHYLNDPEATSRSFIENPAWIRREKSDHTRRFYKTGDLVRQNRDGSLDYLGRTDSQVQLNGHRLELGELEYCVKAFKEVDKVFTTMPLSGYWKNRLVTIVSLGSLSLQKVGEGLLTLPSPGKDDEIYAHLRKIQQKVSDTLPPYVTSMVWVPVGGFPLTTSGKIDRVKARRWLETMDEQTCLRIQAFGYAEQIVSPSTSIEHHLQKLWSDLFNLPLHKIGRNSSFFQLGGNSLAAMKLSAASNDEGLCLSVADILRHPTLEAMSAIANSAKPLSQLEVAPFDLLGEGIDTTALLKDAAVQCGVTEGSIEDLYPATPIQEGLLTLSVLHPGAYVSEHIYALPSTLDQQTFCAAWCMVIKSSPILRTRLVHTRSKTFQVVLRDQFVWTENDNIGTYRSRINAQPMRFGTPLLHFAIVDSKFIITIHHAIHDGWSISLVFKDVKQAYDAGQIQIRPPFKNFVKHLCGLSVRDSEIYWKSQLSGTSSPKFPSSLLSGKVFASASVEQTIPLIQSPSLNVTVATVARAAWTLVNATYMSSSDVVFGSVVSGRHVTVQRIGDIIGPTIATVPIRVQIDDNMPIRDFLQQIQVQSIEMIPHEHFGLQNIQRISSEIRAVCAFQNTFVAHPTSEDSQEIDRLILEPKDENYSDYRTYPLNMVCRLSSFGVVAKIQFDSNIIEKKQVVRIMLYYETLLHKLTEGDASLSIKNVMELPTEEQQEIESWNREIPERVERCVHDLVESCVLQRPDALAVQAWDGSLTYNELDRLSSRLAHHLIGCGIRKETYVPFCFEKSMWTIVAIIGIMKAGGACVPLDTSYPISRMQTIVQEVGASVVVASAQQTQILKGLVQKTVSVCLDSINQLEDVKGPACLDILPSSAVFVTFTSGSTGQPKGIVWEHKNLSSSLMAHGKAANLQPTSRVLQFASYVWDVSICEIITTLTHGGCVCVPSDHDRMNNLVQVMNDMKINWALLTPTFARLIKPVDVPSLETLLLGGESIGKDNVEIWSPVVRLMNAYGPAECCIISCLSQAIDKTIEIGNIGRGVGANCWITDRNDPNRLVPIGVTGELLIEGPILARGYLNHESETAAKFVEAPSWSQNVTQSHPGRDIRRFYRTGDLAKLNSDGTINFQGRADGQVKIRGQRLELGEVEHNLNQHPAIRHSMVMYPKSGPYRNRLCAIFSFEEARTHGHELAIVSPRTWWDGEDTNTHILRIQQKVAETLPSFGVPTVWIAVESIPRASSGKLDRLGVQRWLSTIPQDVAKLVQNLSTDDMVELPRTHVEMQLQQMWSDILAKPSSQIGRRSSFIQLGGDSIGAIRLAATARTRGLNLSVADIFRHPTLDELAEVAITSDTNGVSILLPFSLLDPSNDTKSMIFDAAAECGVVPEAIEDMYPCTRLQEAIMTLEIQQPGTYCARLVYSLPETINLHLFRSAWQLVAQTHAILRTRLIYLKGQQTFQVVVKDDLPWSISNDLHAYLAQDQEMLMKFGQPMVRFAIAGGHFVCTFLHAVYDGWSLPLLFKDFQQAYEAGKIDARPSYNCYIHHLYATDKTGSVAYWTGELAGANSSRFPIFPSATHKVLANTSIHKTLRFSVDSSLGVTLATILRGAWALVIHSYENLPYITHGAILTGRDAPVHGISRTIGPTLAVVPIRVQIDREKNIIQYLTQIQNQTRDMITHLHLAIQDIRHLSADAADACNFRSCLVIDSIREQDVSMLGHAPRWIGETIDNYRTNPMTIACNLTKTGADVTAHFDSKILDREQMNRILSQFQHMIAALVDNDSNTLLDDVVRISPEDQEELLVWNANIPSAERVCTHQLFERVARDNPSTTAVCAWDGQLTYQELDCLSSRLAHHLSELGVVHETFVPFCFEKSMWTVVTILAIMKSGGAFVPLNHTDPENRKRAIIQNCNAKVVVASRLQADSVADLVERVVVLDQSSINALEDKGRYSCPQTTPSSTAYVFFTSGSTGVPKGIVVDHATWSTSIAHHSEPMKFRKGLRTLQFASHVWDISLAESFTALLNVGCVCIPSEHDRVNNIVKVINSMRIQWAVLTPSFARSFSPIDVPGLETLVLVGEATGQDNVDKWAPHVKLLVLYGQVECSIHTTVADMTRPSVTSDNIGKGVGANLWIVESTNINRLAPIGSIGEILVEGPILARGYLNDPERTNASYISDPAWSISSTGPHIHRRFYRTGDLGYYTRDGTIRFVSRKDTLVKIRGQRLELGDVEHHLTQSKQVQHAVVALPKAGPFEGQLVAVITLDEFARTTKRLTEFKFCSVSNRDLAAAETVKIEAFVTARLPTHGVPAVWIAVEDFPRNASGKLDRPRIHDWLTKLDRDSVDTISQQLTDLYPQAATAEDELQLQEVWAEILGLHKDRINRNDSFLRLGGNSLSAIQLSGMMRGKGLLLSVADIFNHPRLLDMTQAVKTTNELKDGIVEPYSLLNSNVSIVSLQKLVSSECGIEIDAIEDIYPTTPLQEFFLPLSEKNPGQFVKQIVHSLPNDLDQSKLREAWQKYYQANPILRTRFFDVPGVGIVQAVIREDAPCEIAHDLDSYLQKDETAPTAWRDRMVRFALVQGHLVVSIHHCIYDGWSLPMFFEDLAKAYDTGQAIRRPPFNRFIGYLQTLDHSKSEPFWRSLLAGAKATTFPPLPSASYRAAANSSYQREISFSRMANSTITTGTVARVAWSLMIARYTGCNDITTVSASTGRNAPVSGIADMLGPVVTSLPMRIKIDPEMPISDLLRDVQTQAIEMVPHEHFGQQNIAKLGPDAAEICSPSGVLIVQPSMIQSDTSPLGPQSVRVTYSNFRTNALLCYCIPTADGAIVYAYYDNNVLTLGRIEEILSSFGQILDRLARGEASWKVQDAMNY